MKIGSKTPSPWAALPWSKMPNFNNSPANGQPPLPRQEMNPSEVKSQNQEKKGTNGLKKRGSGGPPTLKKAKA